MTNPDLPREGSVAAVFSALADSNRRAVLEVISSHGRVSATAIAAQLTISRQGVTKHLALLSEAGLVASTREGREVLYAVQPAPLQLTARWLDRAADTWGQRLDSLKAMAEEASASTGPRRRNPGGPTACGPGG